MARMHIGMTVTLVIALCATLVAVPVAGQDDAYGEAIATGDISSLIPDEFAGSAEIDEASFVGSLGPPPVDGPDAAAAREELLAILDDAGIGLDDVASLRGFTGDEQAFIAFGATRIPGIDASDWFELLYEISLFRSYSDPVRETIEVGPKQVLRISSRGRDVGTLYYGMGEILWSTGDDDLGRAFFDALPTVDGVALGAREPVAQIGNADDPLSQIPAEILGAPAEVQVFPVPAPLSQVDPNDEQAAQDARDFEAMLTDAGSSLEQAEIIAGSAVSDGGGISIVGLHVDGADHTAFVEIAVALILRNEFDSPESEAYQLGGKDVLRVTDAEGSAFSQPAYVYGVGETVWILFGQDEYMDALLATMP